MDLQQNPVGSYFSQLDTWYQAGLARWTLGVSPAAVENAFHAWGTQLWQSPGTMAATASYPLLNSLDFIKKLTGDKCLSCANDPRFASPSWGLWPWRFYMETFLFLEKWSQEATHDVPGLGKQEERMVSFTTRQITDALCPANYVVTNPDLTYKTISQGGLNLAQGGWNAVDDIRRLAMNEPPQEDTRFVVGKNLAVTPGEVIYRNNLIELIQYAPTSKTVFKEPVLILPAWIMKYYILDLSAHNSLVKYLVDQGHTVFMVSWKNPGQEDGDLGLNDYYRLGAKAAIDEVCRQFPKSKIHLAGYCLGGTLAAITAAAMAQNDDNRLKSLSLFAAQTDFTDAGELMVFVSESTVSFMKNMMRMQGYLDTKQMAGAFQMLRSYDLIWSKMVNDYLEGKRRDTFDLTAWNADTTRMPYKMHSEYLEKLFLNNDFAHGKYVLDDKTISPTDIKIPVFAVSTEKDHVAPWQSVYKVHLLVNGEVTFVLTQGGHNAGIVSEPGHPNRAYRIDTRKPGQAYADPDIWRSRAEKREGSWWLSWHDWLVKHSSAETMQSPSIPPGLCKAPGTYILQK